MMVLAGRNAPVTAKDRQISLQPKQHTLFYVPGQLHEIGKLDFLVPVNLNRPTYVYLIGIVEIFMI